VYDVVIQNDGYHPYYCIPHGAPGSIGMAGSITAIDPCEDDSLGVQIQISAFGAIGSGFRIWEDGQLLTDGDYQPGGQTIVQIDLPANGTEQTLTILDNNSPFCQYDLVISMPDCSDDCLGVSAEFSYDLLPEPLSYQFNDLSTGSPDVWNWTFGDGASSTLASPQHTYGEAGNYEVCLAISNSSLNCQDTLCQTIQVGEYICEPQFSYTIEGLDIQFTDESLSSVPIDSWNWTFGDGSSSTDQHPAYLYGELGVYEACLTITADTCSTTLCQTIDLSDPCLVFAPSFSYNIDPETLEVQFVDETSGAPNQWLWGFGDGTTATTQFPFHQYQEPGVYRLCLLVQDTLAGCNEALCEDIIVGTVGTSPEPRVHELSIYPNPSSVRADHWWIEGWQAGDWGEVLEFTLVNIQGKVIFRQEIIPEQRNLLIKSTIIPAGAYLIQVKGRRTWYTGKVIIQ
jgi:PKD repeat protein